VFSSLLIPSRPYFCNDHRVTESPIPSTGHFFPLLFSPMATLRAPSMCAVISSRPGPCLTCHVSHIHRRGERRGEECRGEEYKINICYKRCPSYVNVHLCENRRTFASHQLSISVHHRDARTCAKSMVKCCIKRLSSVLTYCLGQVCLVDH
jgi:hypothetical protein